MRESMSTFEKSVTCDTNTTSARSLYAGQQDRPRKAQHFSATKADKLLTTRQIVTTIFPIERRSASAAMAAGACSSANVADIFGRISPLA